MKSVFRINLTYFMCLTLVSFDFIYSGCCCKKKPSNDGLNQYVNAEAISGFINKRSGTNRARIRGNFLAVLNGDKYIVL